ncbi:hypothetical protein ACFPRL_15820 [Pseudoclavibacter helvolus]
MWSTVAATPRPASAVSPRWPTSAVSVSRKSGSATSAPNAGTARVRMLRSSTRASVRSRFGEFLDARTVSFSQGAGSPGRGGPGAARVFDTAAFQRLPTHPSS